MSVDVEARVWGAGWVPPAGSEVEWKALCVALDEVDPVPCASSREPDAWWSNLPQLVELALEGCAVCPVRDACRAYVLAADERHGIWAGLTELDRRQLAGRSR